MHRQNTRRKPLCVFIYPRSMPRELRNIYHWCNQNRLTLSAYWGDDSMGKSVITLLQGERVSSVKNKCMPPRQRGMRQRKTIEQHTRKFLPQLFAQHSGSSRKRTPSSHGQSLYGSWEKKRFLKVAVSTAFRLREYPLERDSDAIRITFGYTLQILFSLKVLRI